MLSALLTYGGNRPVENGHNIYVATCVVTLAIHGAKSLKDKRAVLNRLKTRVRNEFNISIAEVGDPERRQTAQLGMTSIGGDGQYLEGQMRKAVSFLAGLSQAEIADVQLSVEIKGGARQLAGRAGTGF